MADAALASGAHPHQHQGQRIISRNGSAGVVLSGEVPVRAVAANVPPSSCFATSFRRCRCARDASCSRVKSGWHVRMNVARAAAF
jgi:hypothetical protein